MICVSVCEECRTCLCVCVFLACFSCERAEQSEEEGDESDLVVSCWRGHICIDTHTKPHHDTTTTTSLYSLRKLCRLYFTFVQGLFLPVYTHSLITHHRNYTPKRTLHHTYLHALFQVRPSPNHTHHHARLHRLGCPCGCPCGACLCFSGMCVCVGVCVSYVCVSFFFPVWKKIDPMLGILVQKIFHFLTLTHTHTHTHTQVPTMQAPGAGKKVLIIGGTRFSGLYLFKELHDRVSVHTYTHIYTHTFPQAK